MVAAQSSAVARDDGLDHTPLPYDQDTPVPLKDQVVESYVRTTATPAGQRADAVLPGAPRGGAADQGGHPHYNAERYEEALTQYSAAGARPATNSCACSTAST